MIKFGVIGAGGRIGQRHCAIIKGREDCNLHAICDLNAEALVDINSDGNIKSFAFAEELINNCEECDVISIATPNNLHEKHAVLALKSKKHVIIEKPMALTKNGCERIIHEAFNQGKQVFCVMQNRYSPPSAWLQQVVQDGILGEIYYVQINCFWNRDEDYYLKSPWKGSLAQDGGTLYTQFSHFIDIMYWMFGDIKNISANMTKFKHHNYTEFEDSGSVHFEFAKGGMGSLSFTTTSYAKNLESSMRVVGEKGSVIIGGQYMNEVVLCDIDNYEFPGLPETSAPNNYGKYTGSAANHHFIYENVVQTLSGQASATTNALEGMKVVEIIERIYGASRLKGNED